MKKIFLSTLLLVPSFVFAIDTATFNKNPAKQIGNGPAASIGTIAGKPARRSEGLVFAVIGTVKNFNDAKAMCGSFSPAGKWRLPNEDEVTSDLVILSGFPTQQVGMGPNGAKIYPYWISEGKAVEPNSGTDKFFAFADGAGADLSPINYAETKAQLAKAKTRNVPGAAQTLKDFEKGIAVTCVTDAKNVSEAKPVGSESKTANEAASEAN